MKIGLIVPIGRTDNYGYQYHEFTKLIIKNNISFANHAIFISSSRYVKKELFDDYEKIEFISNEDSWFKLKNDEEVFSFETIIRNVNYALHKLKDEGYDIAIHIHINQYVPESSAEKLRENCRKMLENNKPFTWLYKSYQCGNLLFNSNRKLPWILNLNLPLNWEISLDSLIHKKNKNIIKIQAGNYKKHNYQSIRDVPWEMTIQDGKEKHNFVVKEYRIQNKTYDPKNIENLKFIEEIWLDYYQHKINMKKVSKEELDEVGVQILKLRKKDFVSHIFEENYKPKGQNFFKKLFRKIFK